MRFALVYALMVGAPLLAMMLVLRVGDRLVAPPSVGGEWQLEGAPGQEDLLQVVQSGAAVELRWSALEGRGQLSEGRLQGELGPWRLEARRDGQQRLTGTLARTDPAALVSFVATRRRGPRGQGAH